MSAKVLAFHVGGRSAKRRTKGQTYLAEDAAARERVEHAERERTPEAIESAREQVGAAWTALAAWRLSINGGRFPWSETVLHAAVDERAQSMLQLDLRLRDVRAPAAVVDLAQERRRRGMTPAKKGRGKKRQP